MRAGFLLGMGASFLLLRCAAIPREPDAKPLVPPARPARLLLLVFDQLRPDYPDRYGLSNFRRLSNKGVYFKEAYAGHLAATTVVSNTVLTSGLLPSHLPFQDDLFHDRNGALGTKGAYYAVAGLDLGQFQKLLAPLAEVSLPARLKKARGGQVFAVSQDDYAAYSLGLPGADSVIAVGAKVPGPAGNTWCAPGGLNVPAFLRDPFGNPFYIDCTSPLGSDLSLMPLPGWKYSPSPSPEHFGGDQWVAEAVRSLLKGVKDWRVIMAAFGSVDRVGHLLAEQDGAPTAASWALNDHVDLKSTLLRADQALGKILDALEDPALADTLLVVVSGYGGQTNLQFHGNTATGRGTEHFTSWNVDSPSEKFPLPVTALNPVMRGQLVEATVHDSALRFWLKSADPVAVARFATDARELPGAAEVYTKQDTGNAVHYIRTFRSPKLQGPALRWAILHGQELVEAMGAPDSPEVIVTLLDGEGYGLPGDHGGAQEKVQRIPVWLAGPGLKSGVVSDFPLRLVDLNAVLTRLLDLPLAEAMDGDPAQAQALWVKEPSD